MNLKCRYLTFLGIILAWLVIGGAGLAGCGDAQSRAFIKAKAWAVEHNVVYHSLRCPENLTNGHCRIRYKVTESPKTLYCPVRDNEENIPCRIK